MAAGLFAHPLTAALSTSMATFMLLRMRMNALSKAGLFTTFLIGLLSFGGRAALEQPWSWWCWARRWCWYAAS